MSRMTFALLLLVTAAAVPLRAGDASFLVNSAAVEAQNTKILAAAANPAVADAELSVMGSASFDDVHAALPGVRPAQRLMDREPVDGHVGTVEGMVDTAQDRYDSYKLKNVPDPRLDAAVAYAHELFEKKKVQFDPKLPEIQMGEFEYSPTDKTDEGLVHLNARLALLATRIGEAFCYAPLVHEAAHAKARAEGRLDPANTIENEIDAYRVQYFWVKAIDPSAERMIVLISTLNLRLKDHPEDSVSRLSVAYLHHLLDLYDTHGDYESLKNFVEHHGYRNKDGVDPAATAIRA